MKFHGDPSSAPEGRGGPAQAQPGMQITAQPKQPAARKQPKSSRHADSVVILLSFFDGIGVPILALQEHVKLAHVLIWEVDEQAAAVTLSQVKGTITNRGDITAETGASLAEAVMQIDPSGKLRIMIAGGAPCPDYSRITEGPGREGNQGQLFGTMCDLLDDLLPRLQGRSVGILVENVFMNAYGNINYFNGRLKAGAVLVDAADFGLVSRPRLWWTRVGWSQCTGYKCSRSGRIHRLHVQTDRGDLTHLDMRGFSFGKEVQAGLQSLPCFTTPAPTESGRSAPKKMKTQIDSATRQRWLNDSNTFAPWHYQEAAMVSSPEGRLEVLPPFLKEQAHHLPVDFSKHDLCTDRDRHRLLGNSWHKGVASFLFKIVLEHGMFVDESGF